MAGAAKLTVRRWRARVLVPEDHPAPEHVRERVDAALHRDLPQALAQSLRVLVDDGGDELVCVRRLDLDLVADAAWDRDAIAARCAAVLARALTQALRDNDTANVVRFPSRAEFVARYVAELARGGSAGAWFYRAFSGYAALPVSAALRSVVLDEGEVGLAALRRLDAVQLAQATAALGAAECARVLEGWGRTGEDGDVDTAIAAIVAALGAETAPESAGGGAGLALRLVVRSGLATSRRLRDTAQAVAALLMADATPAGASAVLDVAAMAAVPAALRTRTLAMLAACRPETRQALAHALVQQRQACAAARVDCAATRRGGAFLLLDELFALPLAEVCADWPALAGTSASTIAHFIVLAFCAGADERAAFAADPFWRTRFGIAPEIADDALRIWLARLGRGRWFALARALRRAASAPDTAREDDLPWLLGPDAAAADAWSRLFADAARATLRRFIARLPGFATSSFDHAQRNFLELGATLEEGARIVVRLTRPPLALILNLAGHTRGERRWPLLDARAFVLSSEA